MMKKGPIVFGQNWEITAIVVLGGQVFGPLLITNPQLRGFCLEKVSFSEMKTTDMQI